MKTEGVVGLGDMGSGLAKNLIKNGFSVKGADLLPNRCAALGGSGGPIFSPPARDGSEAPAGLVMGRKGTGVRDSIFVPEGLLKQMPRAKPSIYMPL